MVQKWFFYGLCQRDLLTEYLGLYDAQFIIRFVSFVIN